MRKLNVAKELIAGLRGSFVACNNVSKNEAIKGLPKLNVIVFNYKTLRDLNIDKENLIYFCGKYKMSMNFWID